MTRWGWACTGCCGVSTYCTWGKAFSRETIFRGFKKPHRAISTRKVWGQISVLLQWVVLGPGFRTTAPTRSSFHPPALYHKGLVPHQGNLWWHSHAVNPSLQISNAGMWPQWHCVCTFCSGTEPWELTPEGRASLQVLCRQKPSAPREHHSGCRNYRNYRNVRGGWTKSKEHLALKRCLCRGRWYLYCSSVPRLSFSLRVCSWRAPRLNENLLKGKSEPTAKSKQEITQNRGMAGVGRSLQSSDAESFP